MPLLRIFLILIGSFCLVNGVFSQVELHKNNQKGVLYLGNLPKPLDGKTVAWQGMEGISPEKNLYGTFGTPGVPSASFVLYSDNRKLYVYIEVTDPTPNENPLPAPIAWRNDSVEIYFGVNTAIHDKYALGDNRIRLVPVSKSDPKLFAISINDRDVSKERDIKGYVVYTDKGYRIQAAIPLRLLMIEGFTVGQAIRCDFQINDASSGERENLIHWSAPKDNPYYDASVWGNGEVLAAPEVPQ